MCHQNRNLRKHWLEPYHQRDDTVPGQPRGATYASWIVHSCYAYHGGWRGLDDSAVFNSSSWVGSVGEHVTREMTALPGTDHARPRGKAPAGR